MIVMKNDQSLNVIGTSLKGTFEATYKELVGILGEPCKFADKYKVSTEWKIKFDGHIFTIYDFKETNLYSNELPTVKEFRSDPLPKYWHVGGYENPDYFLYNLLEKIKEKKHGNGC